MNKKGGLGKGLEAIFGENRSALANGGSAAGAQLEVAVDDIAANPYQPRTIFDEEKLRELAASIREFGIVQPLVVRARGSRYELAAGERRLRAARLAGLEKVPVLVRAYDDAQMMEIALIENIQRHDLNPMEEARGLRLLMYEFLLSQDQAAAKVGRSRVAVTNILRLLNLAPEVQEHISSGRLSMGQAKQLVTLPGRERQCEVARAIIDNGWSARITEEVIRRLKEGQQVRVVREIVESLHKNAGPGRKKKQDAAHDGQAAEDVFTRDFAERLIELLGTKVRVKAAAPDRNGRQGGIIEIEYYSGEDLERIYEALGGTHSAAAARRSAPFSV